MTWLRSNWILSCLPSACSPWTFSDTGVTATGAAAIITAKHGTDRLARSFLSSAQIKRPHRPVRRCRRARGTLNTVQICAIDTALN